MLRKVCRVDSPSSVSCVIFVAQCHSLQGGPKSKPLPNYQIAH